MERAVLVGVASPKRRLLFRNASQPHRVTALPFLAAAVAAKTRANRAAVLGPHPEATARLVIDAGPLSAVGVARSAVSLARHARTHGRRWHRRHRLQVRRRLCNRGGFLLFAGGLSPGAA